MLEKNGKAKEVKGAVVTEPDPRYFQTRPSATEGGAYNAAASTFSNRGPNSIKTEEADAENIKAYLELNKPYDPGPDRRRRSRSTRSTPRPRTSTPKSRRPTPGSRPTASRPCATCRLATVDGLIAKYTIGRGLGFSGEQGVNVLELNLALDRLTGRARADVNADVRRPTTHERQAVSLFQRDIVWRALIDSFKKLDPRVQIHNPVMFVVEIGSVITTVTWLIQVFGGKPLGGGHEPAWYTFMIAFWLWLTVMFANMAEAFAEGRGRAQADTLRDDAQGDRRDDARRLAPRPPPSSRAATSWSCRPAS